MILGGHKLMKILIVDDESLERKALRYKINSLLSNDVSFQEASNGLDAINIANTFSPDICFIDIRMPEMTGLEAAPQILKSCPKTSIVIISAYDEFIYAQEAIRFGAKNYLLKPVEIGEIKQVIADYKKGNEEQTSYSQLQEDLNHASIKVAIKYIEANFNRDISMKEVSGKVYLNPSYFSRLFKQETNQNFSEFLADTRVREAKRLLIDTSYSVNLIAELIGYKDAKYFTQIFKLKTGTTPSQYRQNSLIIGNR